MSWRKDINEEGGCFFLALAAIGLISVTLFHFFENPDFWIQIIEALKQ